MNNIITKSIMKFNPNGKELADLIAFVPLLEIDNDRIVLNPKGLKVIESQILGDVHLIALEGDRQSLLYNFYNSTHILNQLSKERKTSGIWISSFPRYDKQNENQYLFLETAAMTQQDRIKIHTICSLICSCILVGMEQTELSYLTSLEGRVIFSRNSSNEKEDKEAKKKEIAHLLLYDLTKGRQLSELKGDHNDIYEYLTEKRVYLECESIYKSLNMFRMALDRIEGQDWKYLEKVEQELKYICLSEQKNQDLLSAPILSWYLEEVVQAMNTTPNVEIDRCLKRVEISEGYDAFLKAVEVYHQRVKKEMKEEGVPKLKEVLQIAREEANDYYKAESTDAQYLSFLWDYIDAKEKRLNEENNKILDLKNIDYLKNESEQLLIRVKREKMDLPTAQREIQLFSERYKERSDGDNRFELFSNYIEYLNTAVYKTISDREAKKNSREVQALSEEKAQLEARVKQLQDRANRRSRENEGCCSSCEVM